MNKKLDIIIKLVISAAVIITLFLLVTPVLKDMGVLKAKETAGPAGFSPAEGSGRPGAAAGGGQRPSGQAASAPPSGRATAQAVKAYTAATGTVSKYIKVNGDVLADVKIDIYPDVSGKVIGLNFSVGDRVSKNDVVASIDPSLPGQQYAVSPVYSTISGTVLNINARVGDKVSVNTSILTVGDLRDLKLVTYIPEKFTGSLRVGLPAEVSFASFPGETFKASISELSPVIDPASRTMEVTLNISDAGHRIRTGMFASIRLATEQAIGVVAVPATAVFRYYGKDTVFIVKKDNTVERRVVVKGLESSEMVEIAEGLTAGEVVVTEGQSLLKEGSSVKIVD